MSDWLQELSELEQQATLGPWESTPNDHIKAWLEPPEMEPGHHAIGNTVYGRDARFVAALRNSAQHLIERARRAEELERTHKPLKQDRSRYTVRVFDGDTPVWDISLSGPELDSERRVAELLQSAANQFEATPNEE